VIELVAQRSRVLGEPMRIELRDRPRDGDATVGELQEALGASPNPSRRRQKPRWTVPRSRSLAIRQLLSTKPWLP
jgi:hypothetical protein